jgi:MFS family permease
MEDMLIEEKPHRARRVGILTLAGALTGLLVGWLVGRLVKAHQIPELPWADVVALAIAVGFMGFGLLMLLLTVNQPGRAILAQPDAPEFGREVMPSQTTLFLLQASVLILAGAMLAAPVIFEFIALDAQGAMARPLMAAVLVCFAVQTWLNLLIWRRTDEVFRQVIAETGALSFWSLQGVYFLWACGEKLKVLPIISSWDAVAVLMGAYLMVSTIVAYRRGLG